MHGLAVGAPLEGRTGLAVRRVPKEETVSWALLVFETRFSQLEPGSSRLKRRSYGVYP